MKVKVLIVFYFLFGIDVLFATEFVKIYFTNWNYLRRAAYDEITVRNKPDIVIQIYDISEINSLSECLNFSNLQSQGYVNNESVDIVIDFIIDDVVYKTYILNKFYYYKKGEQKKYTTPRVILNLYTLYSSINLENDFEIHQKFFDGEIDAETYYYITEDSAIDFENIVRKGHYGEDYEKHKRLPAIESHHYDGSLE